MADTPRLVAQSIVAPVPAPAVTYGGCVDVVDGVCLTRGRTKLVVWIDVHSATPLDVRIDGAPVEPKAVVEVDGGARVSLEVSPEARGVEIAGTDPPWTEPWSLALRPWPPAAVLVEADRIRIGEHDLESATAVALAALPSLTGVERLDVLVWLSKAEYNATAPPVDRYREVIALARTLGYPKAEATALNSLLQGLRTLEKPDEFRTRLAELDRVGQVLPFAASLSEAQHGKLARARGDLSEAIRRSERGLGLIDRLGVNVAGSLDNLAGSYVDLGDWTGLRTTIDRLHALLRRPEHSCPVRLQTLLSLSWAQLRGLRARALDVWPVPPLEEALALADPGGRCPDPLAAANARMNMALYWLLRDDPELALVWLDEIAEVPGRYASWEREVRGRAAARTGRYWRVESPLLTPIDERADDRWNAWVRQARLLDDLGAKEAAIDAWAAAEAIIGERAASLDRSGAEQYAEARSVSASGLVAALIERGRTDEALCRARLARGRPIRQLDLRAAVNRQDDATRQRWRAGQRAYLAERVTLARDAADDVEYSTKERARRVARRMERQHHADQQLDAVSRPLARRRVLTSCAELPAMDEGTALLVLFPSETGWFVFVADASGVDVRAAGALDDHLLDGVSARLVAAERIRVLSTGEAWSLTVPSLSVQGGATLLDLAPIAFGLDIEPRAPPSTKSAVVVADPSGDLTQTQGEAAAVRTALAERGWKVSALHGAEASRDAVFSALGQVSLLHYAGHGRSRGKAGWDAALVLHEGQALTVTDILSLPSAPATVVLSACETGRADVTSLTGGMSVGRAFLLAGSSAVLVADVKVDDSLARAVSEGLYVGMNDGASDLATALRRAQLQLRKTQPESDWAAFRVIVR